MLAIATRTALFKYLGLGEYNSENILKFKKKYLPKQYWDGKYTQLTENLLRHCYNVKRWTKNFSPEEFKCKCGRCSGYPSFMKENELKNLQTVRDKYGKPMTITSGIRCKSYNNSLPGHAADSPHLYGMAADFYIPGVTETLASRKALIGYMQTLPAFHWAYGNGYGATKTSGTVVNAPNMGNAVHLDSTLETTGERICKEADKLIAKVFVYVFYKINKYWPKNGGNCIRFVALCLANAGIKVSTKQDGLLNDKFANQLIALCIKGQTTKALEMWENRNGKGWKLIWNGNKKIPVENLNPGDVLLCFDGSEYKHTALKHKGKNIADCTSSHKVAKVRAYTKTKDVDGLTYPCKLAFRYTK